MKRSDGFRPRILRLLQEAAWAKVMMVEQSAPVIEEMARRLAGALRAGRRVYVFGNGGSAADAQHIACELEGRFYRERRALPVLALTTNTSTLTAIGNDYDYAVTFKRQVQAHVRRGDVVIAISTSGNSRNVLEAAALARRLGATVIALTGRSGGKLKRLAHVCFFAPSDETPRIQECHITAAHIVCELVEAALD
ncbi:MAG: SIS domain-containing protein [Planctomycetes bacterium]|nr:SIS domain-containing protein [Planctomycetota bacterium]